MRRVMWKFRVQPGKNEIYVPAGGAVLSVARDGQGEWCAYVICNADANTKEKRVVHLVGTGFDIPDEALCFLCTITDGAFVWHVFI